MDSVGKIIISYCKKKCIVFQHLNEFMNGTGNLPVLIPWKHLCMQQCVICHVIKDIQLYYAISKAYIIHFLLRSLL